MSFLTDIQRATPNLILPFDEAGERDKLEKLSQAIQDGVIPELVFGSFQRSIEYQNTLLTAEYLKEQGITIGQLCISFSLIFDDLDGEELGEVAGVAFPRPTQETITEIEIEVGVIFLPPKEIHEEVGAKLYSQYSKWVSESAAMKYRDYTDKALVSQVQGKAFDFGATV